MSVTFVLGSFVTLYRIRVLYKERGRERGAGISPPKDQFLSPPPLPDLGHNICNISQKHKLYMYVKVASILLKACKTILFYRGGLGRWGEGGGRAMFSYFFSDLRFKEVQPGPTGQPPFSKFKSCMKSVSNTSEEQDKSLLEMWKYVVFVHLVRLFILPPTLHAYMQLAKLASIYKLRCRFGKSMQVASSILIKAR